MASRSPASCAPSGGGRPADASSRRFIRERLSPQKTPSHWIWVDEWPLTGSGKIQKFKLRESFEAGAFLSEPAPMLPAS